MSFWYDTIKFPLWAVPIPILSFFSELAGYTEYFCFTNPKRSVCRSTWQISPSSLLIKHIVYVFLVKSLISCLTFDGDHHLRIASSSPLPNWSCVYNWKDFRQTVNGTLGLNLQASSLTLPSRILRLCFPLKSVTCSRTSCSSPALSSAHLGVSEKTPSYSAYESVNLCHHTLPVCSWYLNSHQHSRIKVLDWKCFFRYSLPGVVSLLFLSWKTDSCYVNATLCSAMLNYLLWEKAELPQRREESKKPEPSLVPHTLLHCCFFSLYLFSLCFSRLEALAPNCSGYVLWEPCGQWRE